MCDYKSYKIVQGYNIKLIICAIIFAIRPLSHNKGKYLLRRTLFYMYQLMCKINNVFIFIVTIYLISNESSRCAKVN